MASERLQRHKFRQGVAAAIAAATVALIVFLVAAVAKTQECPLEATQAEIDLTGCIVGANIGLGLVVLVVAPLVLAIGGAAAYFAWPRSDGL